MLLLEEIIFSVGTSFVTISVVLILAGLERRGLPWWVLPASVILPIDWLVQMAGTDVPNPRELDPVKR